jgi:hypothetical protein
MPSALENFISQIRTSGVARPNRFSVEILTPECMGSNQNPSIDSRLPELINLYCQTASIPGQNIGVRDLRITGPTYKRPVNIDYGGEGITFTFLMDGKLNIKSFFDIWMQKIIDPFQFQANYDYGLDTYTTRIIINQINEVKFPVARGTRILETTLETPPYRIVLENAFPRNIGMMELDQSSQSTAHKMNVTFAYRKLYHVSDLHLSARYQLIEPSYQ